MKHTIPLTIAAVLLAMLAGPAFAQREAAPIGKDMSKEEQKKFMAGWEYDRAPINTQLSIFTDFMYHAADSSTSFDFANMTLKANAQFGLSDDIAVFGQWGAKIIDGDPKSATGLADLFLGAKYALINDPNLIFSVGANFGIPVDTSGGGLGSPTFGDAKVSQLMIMGTLFLYNSTTFSIGGNIDTKFAGVFADAVEPKWDFHFTIEGFITVFNLLSGKLGLEGDYNGSIKEDGYLLYIEGQFKFGAFLRLALPISINSLKQVASAVENSFNSGDFTVTAGWTLAF